MVTIILFSQRLPHSMLTSVNISSDSSSITVSSTIKRLKPMAVKSPSTIMWEIPNYSELVSITKSQMAGWLRTMRKGRS